MAKPNFAKKNITRIRNGRKRICIFMHSTGFLAVKITQISFFSFFNGIYETRPFKNYATLWCRAWRISYDMSSAYGEAKFCEKKWKDNITRIRNGRKRICIFVHSKQLFVCQNHWNFNFSFFRAPLIIVVIIRMTHYKLRCVVCTCQNKILVGIGKLE